MRRCNISIFTTLAMMSLVSFACHSSKKLLGDSSSIDFDVMKKHLGLKSDSECLDRILKERIPGDTIRILFSDGAYHFDETLSQRELEGNWIMSGRGHTKFFLTTTLFNVQAPKCKLEFEQVIPRHSKQIEVSGTCEEISLLRITSDKIVESAWNYTAGDLVRVQKEDKGRLNFADSLNFAYEPGRAQIFGYKGCSIGLRGIEFIYNSDHGYMFSFTGVSPSIIDCDFKYTGEKQIPAFVTIYDCEPINISRVEMVGKVDYGFLINGSRNVWCTDIRSKECVHPIVPATWTTNVNVKGIHCTGSVIDAHPSFYVSYQDVSIERGEGYWNCRALGVKLENCYFDVVDRVADKSLYLGVLALTEEYAFLYHEYDVYCRNVNWIHPDYMFNGLHVHQCRDFIVDDCKTHAVSTGDKIRSFKVRNSTIGRLYCSDSNFEARNTVFDASLQQRDMVIPPLSCSYDGTMIIDQCTFTGYDSTYLFRYIQSGNTELRMTDTDISFVKGFAAKTYLSEDSYSRIQIDSTRLSSQVVKSFNSFSRIKYMQ